MEVYLVEKDEMTRIPESELDTKSDFEQRRERTEGAKARDVS